MTRLSFGVLSVLCLLWGGAATAHELWLEAERWQISPGSSTPVNIINGEGFEGARLGYFPQRVKRFDIALGDAVAPVIARAGDVPALTFTAATDGLHVVVYEPEASRITYKEWEKFVAFAEHKDFPDIAARHDATGAPREGFAEAYTRHAKALIAVGDGAGADRVLGLETEFVAETNPYGPNFDSQMRVQLLYQDAARPDAQVEVYDRAPDGTVTVDASYRTDQTGRVTIPVQPGHTYLFDAVVLRPHTGETDAVWDTLWAALAFAVPAQ